MTQPVEQTLQDFLLMERHHRRGQTSQERMGFYYRPETSPDDLRLIDIVYQTFYLEQRRLLPDRLEQTF